ncbi:assimilatory nitrite reductase (NAD(P)H) small subunit [Alteromonadaceae bacterium Bs31]|nr:assimilatory nitrite reductase (NAD(P)H) small subunit [Alteromonadaceae bacterium Bs31]
MSSDELQWISVCEADELSPLLGVRALLDQQQIALFNVKGELYAIDAIDPFTDAAVLSRGIVGDIKNQVVVASPIYKQHFSLASGICLEDESVSVKTYPVREKDGKIQLGKKC